MNGTDVQTLSIGDKLKGKSSTIEVEVLDLRVVGICGVDATVLVMFAYKDWDRIGVAETGLLKFLEVLA